MAISARSRRGTSSSFWRNHNAMQTMMVQACMPSIRPEPKCNTPVVSPSSPSSPIVPRQLPAIKFFIAQA